MQKTNTTTESTNPTDERSGRCSPLSVFFVLPTSNNFACHADFILRKFTIQTTEELPKVAFVFSYFTFFRDSVFVATCPRRAIRD